MAQKEQRQAIKDFQSGVFNVLVATAIGEEARSTLPARVGLWGARRKKPMATGLSVESCRVSPLGLLRGWISARWI